MEGTVPFPVRCPGVTKSCSAGSREQLLERSWAPDSPFQCARDSKHRQAAETLQHSCVKLHCRGGGWGNEEQPYILPRTGLGLHCSTEGLFSVILDRIAATGAGRENMTQHGSSVARGVAGPLA